MAVVRQEILVGAAHRAGQELVAHRARIDEEILVARGGAVQGRKPGESGEDEAVALGGNLERVRGELVAEDRGQPRAPRQFGRPLLRLQAHMRAIVVARDGERDRGICHREAQHRVQRLLALGSGRFQELEPGGRREEQVAHLDQRAARERSRDGRALGAALDRERPCLGFAAAATRDAEPAHRADRRQRLAAESERADTEEIVVRQLRGAVPLDREEKLVAGHADAIVAHRNEALPAGQKRHLDAGGSGVDRVLDQLFHRRGRALHHLAGGDAVDDDRRELAQHRRHCAPWGTRRQASLRLRRASRTSRPTCRPACARSWACRSMRERRPPRRP